jgi:hypothetical protein
MGHRTHAVLLCPPHAPKVWFARCDECGPVSPDFDPAALGDDEAYRRTVAEARVHQRYPDGAVITIGGAQVVLR